MGVQVRRRRIRQCRLDITNTQATDEPGDDQRLQRVGLGHPGAKQPRGEAFAGTAQLGPLHRDRPCGGLDRGRAGAVATARACVLDTHAALVTGPAEELGRLRLQRGLDAQPGTEASDLLQHLDQVTVTAEQASISAPIRWVGDTRLDTGVGPPSQTARS
jgi:hypothetical protein